MLPLGSYEHLCEKIPDSHEPLFDLSCKKGRRMSNNFSPEAQFIAERLLQAKYAFAFSGAGISLESGIPVFRGSQGLWQQYDPQILEIQYFRAYPEKSWPVIREIFYDHFAQAEPNPAHRVLADWEHQGFLQSVITQNIDNLHQKAGHHHVHEFHGTLNFLRCDHCGLRIKAEQVDLSQLPPVCSQCQNILRPDFVFFGEGIPAEPYHAALEAAQQADLIFVVGTTGEVMPASMIPRIAKDHGAFVVEINPETSLFSASISDVHLRAPAGEIFPELNRALQSLS